MGSGTFNDVALGDIVHEVVAGDITRSTIVDEVLGRDGAITRSRGGGIQRVTVRFGKACTNAYERASYAETLSAAMGTGLATLKVELAGGIRMWVNSQWERIAEVGGYMHNYISLEVTFVRSAF